MRILYGVQGTGNGHVSRARAMVPALRAKGCTVDFLFSGRPAAEYFDMAVFGQWRSCDGVTFVVEGGRVRLLRSAASLRLRQWWQDVRSLPMARYDLVITDFEPVTAWAARRAGVPCLNLSHQAAFSYPVPRMASSRLTGTLMRHYAPAKYRVGLHWHHFGQPILPPLIEPVTDHPDPARSLSPIGAPTILVYLPFEQRQVIEQLLLPLTGVSFVCFHPAVPEDEQQGHLHWRRLSRPGFQQALAQASGVIANAGFELPSEALTLGRKLLVRPLTGQFEQQSNALSLDRLGLATRILTLETRAVERWLEGPAAEPISYPAMAPVLADWLMERRWGQVDELASALWSQVRFPSYFREPLPEG